MRCITTIKQSTLHTSPLLSMPFIQPLSSQGLTQATVPVQRVLQCYLHRFQPLFNCFAILALACFVEQGRTVLDAIT